MGVIERLNEILSRISIHEGTLPIFDVTTSKLRTPSPPRDIREKGSVPRYESEWRTWSERFLPIYTVLDADKKEIVCSLLSDLPYLQQHSFLRALCDVNVAKDQKNPACEQLATGLSNAYKGLFSSEQLTSNHINFLRILRITSLPISIKEKFPLQEKKEKEEQPFDSTSVDVIQFLLLSSESVKKNVKKMLNYLEYLRTGSTALPESPDFTKEILQAYGDSRNIRIALKNLHRSNPQWADTQKPKLIKKNEKKKKK